MSQSLSYLDKQKISLPRLHVQQRSINVYENLKKCVFQNAPANKDSAQVEKCFINRGQPSVAYAQSPALVQPGDGGFDHPPGLAQVAAMRSPAFGHLVSDTALFRRQALCTTVVSKIDLNGLGLFQWPPALSADRAPVIDQWQELRDVMPVQPWSERHRPGCPLRRRGGDACRPSYRDRLSSLCPPCTARTDELKEMT